MIFELARRRIMKTAFVALLFAASAFAQDPSAVATTACGPKDVTFNVKLDKSQDALTQPEAGRALIYFIQDTITTILVANPTTKLALDGAWVGANHGDSYFSVSVEPGEHHVCASSWYSRASQRVELAHLTAVAGNIYYYRTRLIVTGELEYVELDPIDSDQGKYLIASFPLSVSTPKK
jgi:hypothetical protein